MSAAVEFLIGLLEQEPSAYVAWEDLEGDHGDLLRACQEEGFLGREPLAHPVPSCPHCGEGVPYRLGALYLCNRCRSAVEPRHLRCWGLDVGAFLGWLTSRLGLRGTVRRVENRLWHLGAWGRGDEVYECFYRRGGELSELGRTRLAAYRNALVLYGLSPPPEAMRHRHRCVSLLELLRAGKALAVGNLRTLLRPNGTVRFEPHSGALWVGDSFLGEVPPGCKEYHLLRCLARHIDHFVSYADLKYEVLRQSASTDTAEEAAFCQSLKRRIKKKWIPKIDLLIVTTNKADGYRLRGYAEL